MKPGAKKEVDSFSRQIAEKEKRKLKSLRNKNNVWFGLGMMGMIGWSVVVPAVLGALGGLWLDKKYPQTFSWTLTLLIAGLVTGSVIAWYWVDKEDKEMHQNKEQKDE
ncbi:MAG: AtpZ/AtpI family protein [Bacteroidia bacterium]|nr:AtpZ/AtpI family protein [Bacteroidia bacterium]